MKRQKRRANTGMILVILAAVLYLTGCGAGQNTAGADRSAAAGGLDQEKMGLLCYYRHEKDENFDSDMEIVEGRIDALTDGRYLREETELETESGPLQAVNFYVPWEVYGDYSLEEFSKMLISRPMNLWLSNNESENSGYLFDENIALPRDAIESVELLEGCPDNYNPLDYGEKPGKFIYLKIKLTEEYCKENSQIWEWQRPFICQDVEGYEGIARVSVVLDAESHCIIQVAANDRRGILQSKYFSFTHEPLSKNFYLYTLPAIEWESGEEIKGAGQIESSDFKTATVLKVYTPEEIYVNDRNWEQTLQAIRERMDATGIAYALGHLPGDDRSVVIRMEDGVFAREFMDDVVKNAEISFTALGVRINESSSGVKVTAEVKSPESPFKVLDFDMSALRKETFYRLSENCVKSGGGRIVLRINGKAVADGDCDEIISDGRFVMTYNAFTTENGFENPMEWLPDFLEALISGTPIPMISSYRAAVTLRNREQVYLSKEGHIWLPPDDTKIPSDKLVAALMSRMGDMDFELLGTLETGTPCIQFAVPEGDTRNEKIAETVSRVLKDLKEDIFIYGIRIDFVDGNGECVIKFIISQSAYSKNDARLHLSTGFIMTIAEEDEAEISKLLNEDETITDFVSVDD